MSRHLFIRENAKWNIMSLRINTGNGLRLYDTVLFYNNIRVMQRANSYHYKIYFMKRFAQIDYLYSMQLYRHFIRIILIWNGHVHIFTYSNKKGVLSPTYLVLQFPHSIAHSQQLHGNSIFIWKSDRHNNKKRLRRKKRIPIKIRREFV